MWLLHRSIDGDIKLVEFPQGHAPKYAILSHKWLADEDKVSFQLMGSGPPEPDDVRCNKIHFCVEQAAKDGLDYCWVDTCCIDKSSFAPIEESIRNIYYWYRDAEKCYVYLSDVSTGDADSVEEACREEWEAGFRGSTWFTRIWTLQEVLAPKEVEVFSAEGVWLGNKMTLETLLYEKMGVPRQVLRGADMATFAIEEKLSWGKDRQTGCVEDMAYGILGLFDVTAMELRYGEGSQALVRLPEEAEKREAELGVEYLDGVYLAEMDSAVHKAHDNQEKEEMYLHLRHTLGAVSVFYTPLSLASISNLLGHLPIDVANALTKMPSILNISHENSGPVTIHHPSFRDFFFNKNRCTNPNFTMDEKHTHKIVANACARLLTTTLKRTVQNLKSPGGRPPEREMIARHISPELVHACRFYIYHQRDSGVPLRKEDQMHRFFEECRHHWYMAMLWTGHVLEVQAIREMCESELW